MPPAADASDLALRWARVVEAAHDPVMAVGYVRSELEGDPARVVAALDVVLTHATVRHVGALGLLVAVGAALAPHDASELRARLASAASEHALSMLAGILGAQGAAQSAGDDELERIPDFGRGRPLALGERKSLARRRDRQLLARVLRDPHPDVIRVLLGNPALTQDDVVRLVARRPIVGDVLREVAASVRWIARGAVRAALLKNPYAPLEISLPLVPLATSTELAELAASPELSVALRSFAERAARVVTLH
ncbi:MAG: hypothetical protein U0234_06235 [Sandaracinus sp.]